MLKFDFKKFANEALSEIGDVLVSEAQGNMDEVSSGRLYLVGGKVHVASRAGDSPNNMSGELKKTIRFKIQGKVLEFGAGNEKIDYAKFLELGTNKMAVRPNYTKSIVDSKSKIDKVIKKSLVKNIRFTK